MNYPALLKSLSDPALRHETIRAVYDGNALKIESCRKQWEALGRASVFIECYNRAVEEMR